MNTFALPLLCAISHLILSKASGESDIVERTLLSEVPPSNSEELAILALALLAKLRDLHSKSLFVDQVRSDYLQVPLLTSQKPDYSRVRLSEKHGLTLLHRENHAQWRANNLGSLVSFLKNQCSTACSHDKVAHDNIALLEHRVSSSIDSPDSYGRLAEIVQRILWNTRDSINKSIYDWLLTNAELQYIENADADQDVICNRRLLRFEPGGFLNTYIRSSRIQVLQGEGIQEWTAVNAIGGRVRVRTAVNTRRFSESISRERSVLSILNGAKGFPILRRPRLSACRRKLLVQNSPRLSIPIRSLGSVSLEFVYKIAVRGLILLSELHNLGFTHGDISDENLVLNSVTRDPESLTFADLRHTRPWSHVPRAFSGLHDDGFRGFSLERERPQTGRRDDLYRFAKVLVDLVGFSGARFPDQIMSWEYDRSSRTPRLFPSSVMAFLNDVKDLSEDAEPPYETFIENFKRISNP
jgi:hypothetical protein